MARSIVSENRSKPTATKSRKDLKDKPAGPADVEYSRILFVILTEGSPDTRKFIRFLLDETYKSISSKRKPRRRRITAQDFRVLGTYRQCRDVTFMEALEALG